MNAITFVDVETLACGPVADPGLDPDHAEVDGAGGRGRGPSVSRAHQERCSGQSHGHRDHADLAHIATLSLVARAVGASFRE